MKMKSIPFGRMCALGGALVVYLVLMHGSSLKRMIHRGRAKDNDGYMRQQKYEEISSVMTQAQQGPWDSSTGMCIPVGPTGIVLTQDMNPALLEEAFFMYLMLPGVHCQKIARMGRVEDGGWFTCADSEIKPARGECLVYSFGISNDWSFDEAVSEAYQCEVHSFDPSIGKEDHKHSENVWFHNIGISGTDGAVKKYWKGKTLKTIINELNHNDRVLDILKMDVEFSEWEAIPDMIESGALKKVKQFFFELHINATYRFEKPDGLFHVYKLLKSVDDAGFRRFQTHINKHTHYVSKITDKTRYAFMELFYINNRFLTNEH